MKQISYPRIPHNLKQHIKLTTQDIEQIKHLYYSGQVRSIKGLAESFNVHPKTITYWIDPISRQLQIERRIENLKKQKLREPDFVDRQKVWIKNSNEYHHRIDPSYRTYLRFSSSIAKSNTYKTRKPVPAFRKFMEAVET